MQCPACRAVYSNGLDNCPRCKTPAAALPTTPTKSEISETPEAATSLPASELEKAERPQPAATAASTLIEFPGTRAKPQWRKQLSERVREIQERRAREAIAQEAEVAAQTPLTEQAVVEANTTPLGLVPPAPAPELNPIVVAALRRIERARQPQTLPPVTRSSRGGAAVARVAEEQYQEELSTASVSPALTPLPQTEAAPARNLVVVPVTPAPVKPEPEVKPLSGSIVKTPAEDAAASELEADTFSEGILEDGYDDRAPVIARLTASLIDFLVVAFASSPFAAVIELTNGNWADARVSGSMGAIVLVVMFLYLTASTALAGRTWGMSLLSLRAVDADTGSQPTTKQAVGRALLYMLSLATLGLGILYALFDAEGRTAHDHLSSTAVVQE
jgi:uncharacterized RDD family membrane protein YckC